MRVIKWIIRTLAILMLVPLVYVGIVWIWVSYQQCPFGLRYALSQSGYQLSVVSNRDGDYQTYFTYVMNADGSQQVRTSSAIQPEPANPFASTDSVVVSPDEQYVVMTGDGLWLVDSQMTTFWRVIHPVVRVTGYSWSPNGKFLAIADGALTIVDVENRTMPSLPQVPIGGTPRWSPDGKYVAFALFHMRGLEAREAGLQNWEVYIADVDSLQSCLLTTNMAYDDLDPQWLPQ